MRLLILLLPSVLVCDALPTYPDPLLPPRLYVLQKYWSRPNGPIHQQPIVMRGPDSSRFIVVHQIAPFSDLSRVRFIPEDDSEENGESYLPTRQEIPLSIGQKPNQVFGNNRVPQRPSENEPRFTQNFRPTKPSPTGRPGTTTQTRPETNRGSSFGVPDTSTTSRLTPENQRRTVTTRPKSPSQFGFTDQSPAFQTVPSTQRPGTGTRDEIHNHRRTEIKTNSNRQSFRVGQPTKTTTEKPTIIFPQRPHKPSHFGQNTRPLTTSTPTIRGDTKPNVFGDVRDVQDNFSGLEFVGRPFHPQRNRTAVGGKLDAHPDRNPQCYVKPDPGTCRAALPRYFLDPKTGTCNCFLYGGCRDDGLDEGPGTFFTLADCQHECHPPSMEEGPICKEIFKDDDFISYLDPLPQNSHTHHLNDQQFLASLA